MKACLLLHGFITDEDDFKPLMYPLSKMYDKVLAITLPGHGKNPNYKEFKANKTLDAVINAYDTLKEEYDTIDLIGFSMGGALATYLSSKREINKMVLLSPANKFLNPFVIINMLNFYVKQNKLKGDLKKNKESFDHIDTNIKNARENNKRSFDMAFNQLFPNYTIHTLVTFVSVISKCNKEVKEIKNPTLIIWGKLDQLVPKESVKYDYKLCTNSNRKLIIFEEYSHLMLHSVNPDKIVREVIDFLK